MERSPYLKPTRLNDLLAAIQTTGLHEKYRHTAKEWALLISGNDRDPNYWAEIFREHPEFFRKATGFEGEGQYALILRRASARRYSKGLTRLVNDEEFTNLSTEDQKKLLHAPVSEGQLKLLMDAAVSLHKNALEASRDWRWWVAPVLAFIASFGGTLLAIWFKSLK